MPKSSPVSSVTYAGQPAKVARCPHHEYHATGGRSGNHGSPERHIPEPAHARRCTAGTFPCVVGFVIGAAPGAALELRFAP